MHTTFIEYLDQKKKTIEKGKIEKVSDYHGPKDTKPPGEQGKGGKPYLAAGKGGKPKGTEKGKALGDEGDKNLIYNPDTEKETKKAHWTETEKWLSTTRNMPLSEFVSKIRRQTMNGLENYNGSPLSTVKQAVELCKVNEHLFGSLIREMKRSDLLDNLVSELFQHQDAFESLSRLLEDESHGEKAARRLVRAMNEIVGPPAHDDDEEHDKERDMPNEDDEEDFPEEEPDDFGNEEEEEFGDDEDMDFGDEPGDEENMDDMGDDMGDSMGDDGMSKKHSHDHIIDAMKNNPRMMKSMKRAMLPF